MTEEMENKHLVLTKSEKKRVVVIGGGFAGIEFIKELDEERYDLVLLDRHNYHTFQPLLYQVATAGLEPDSIAQPLRKLFAGRKNFQFRVANVEKVDTATKVVYTDLGAIDYDMLVVANGTKTNFFGQESIRQNSFPLKQVPHALDLRSHMLQTFEAALLEEDLEKRKGLMQFVIVGGGPTGVELAGAFSELKNHVLPKDYPELDFKQMTVTLVENSDRLLGVMSEFAGRKSEEYLRKFGVEILLNTKMEMLEADKVFLSGNREVPSQNVIWAAGVTGNSIDGFSRENVGRGNRLKTDPFGAVLGMEGVYALGDIALMTHEAKYPDGHPQVAPTAIQQGKRLGKNLNRLDKGLDMVPYAFFDKGTMATIGRNKAVVDLPFWGLSFGGFFAWLTWMFVHILYLVGFRNKVVTFTNWLYSYFTFDRSTRLIIRPFIKAKVQDKMTIEQIG